MSDNDKTWTEMIEQNKGGLAGLGRDLFACPELGFKEVKSAGILTSFFCQNQIACETGLSLTGVKATVGRAGGYHIALVADMDAVLVRDGEKSYPYHSCGHSIQTAVMAWVLKLLKDSGITERTGGRVSFIAAPAEEFIDLDFRRELAGQGRIKYFSGKQNMIRDGVFDDVDCVLTMHINGETDTLFDVGSTLAGFSVKRVSFLGQASHSGAAPHLGRNALQGASLFLNALAYLKDQFSPASGVSIHPVLTSCGGSVNVIPEQAALETYIRANTLEGLLAAGDKFDHCALHCAAALGLEARIEDQVGYMPLKQSDQLNTIILGHMRKLCPEEKILKGVVSGASGDVGDLGYLLPTVQFGFSGMKGRIHSSDFAIVNEENAYQNTARIVLLTVRDLLEQEKLRPSREGFEERKAFYLKNWLREKESKKAPGERGNKYHTE